MRTEARSERGVILIVAAASLFALLLFMSFVVDYGFMWVGRSQIQTSADAAALAGAVSYAFDNTTTENVQARAQAVGQANTVWGEAPSIQTSDVQIVPCPSTPGLPANDKCVQVRAYRNGSRNNPLPTLFAQLAGIEDQGVQALAVARPVSANGTNCLKPWAVADKWFETQAGGWTQSSTYDPSSGDYYTPPTASNPGTGFSARDANGNPDYYGYQMVLKISNPGGSGSYSSGWAMELALNNDSGGSSGSNSAYVANITGCTTDQVAIAQPGTDCLTENPGVGCIGVKTGSGGNTNQKAIDDFIDAHDPSAVWVDGSGPNGWRTGSITTSESPSSRIVPVAVFDLPQYLSHNWHGTNGIIRVVNILGFFIEGTCQDVTGAERESYLDCPSGGSAKAAIVGRLVNYPGITIANGASVAGSYGQVIQLVR
jgi:Flp pilus assembly protein TadG